jgi:hypothetical protein
MKNTGMSSRIVLILASFGCLALLLAALFVAMTFEEAFDSNSISPLPVPEVTSTARDVSTIPLRRGAFSEAEAEELTKKLIMEYIVVRYTVNGSTKLMNEALGLDGGVSFLELASVDFSTDRYFAAFNEFKSGASGDVAEITKYMNDGYTRSVLIVDGPRRYADYWVTEAEFITRSPTTISAKDARRERFVFRMYVIGPTFSAPFEYAVIAPSALFGFKVQSIEKIPKP